MPLAANPPLTPALRRLDLMLSGCATIPMEFTRRGGLPEIGCLPRFKIGRKCAGGSFNSRRQMTEC